VNENFDKNLSKKYSTNIINELSFLLDHAFDSPNTSLLYTL